MNKSKEISRFLKERLYQQKRWLIGSFIFAALTVGIEIAQNQLTKNFFDKGLGPKDWDKVISICLALVLYFFIEGILTYFHRYMLRAGAESMVKNLRKEVFERFLTLSQAQYAPYTSGRAVNHIISDVSVICQGLHIIADLIQSPLTIIGMLGYLFYLNWQLTLICFIALPVVGIVGKVLGSSARRNQGRIQSVLERLSNHIIESIRGMRTAHAFNQTPQLRDEFDDKLGESYRLYLKLATIEELAAPLTKWVTSWVGALLIGCGAYFVIRDSNLAAAGDPHAFTTGALISFLMAAGRIQQPLRQLNQVAIRLQQTMASAERIHDVLGEPLDVVSHAQQKILSSPPPRLSRARLSDNVSLSFNDVSFRYVSRDTDSTNPLALRNINLELSPGKRVALVGRSGSGKSTLSLLAMRFLDPVQGQVVLSGKASTEWDLRAYRDHFAYVSQDVYLFNRSLRDNLLFANPQSSDADIWRALENAHIADFIRTLPRGLETHAGEFAASLSGGEKQRIAIARAFLKDAPILILDEATSQLDAHSEAGVQRALHELLAGRSAIIIAHRLTTVREVSEVLVMEQGRVVERGEPRRLLEDADGAFSELWKAQVEGAAT
ncbi:MAG: ABC transporter ATP-binding protein [Bdellovibrionota bacterium]